MPVRCTGKIKEFFLSFPTFCSKSIDQCNPSLGSPEWPRSPIETGQIWCSRVATGWWKKSPICSSSLWHHSAPQFGPPFNAKCRPHNLNFVPKSINLCNPILGSLFPHYLLQSSTVGKSKMLGKSTFQCTIQISCTIHKWSVRFEESLVTWSCSSGPHSKG
jgi:hypothetical protein